MEESSQACGWIGKHTGGKEKGSMNSKLGFGRWLAAVAAFVFVAAACGSTGGSGNPSPASKGTLTVAGFNFPESSILAEIYGQALAHDGYTINYKLLLGTREVVAPALDPSAAVDQNAFAVTKATQTKYNLTSLSDLAAIGGQLTLGAGPECPTRPFCQPGLKSTYGITFKAFKALDTDGPLTRAAFKNGSIDVGLVFSSDGDLNSLGLVVLKDDKHLENADNVVPILRQAASSDEVKKVLNAIDAKLTTADLVTLNSQVSIQHQDADAVATAWLQQHNYAS